MPWACNRGHYVLVLDLEKRTRISVGKLGTFTFSPGLYCYVGRARTLLKQRLARHCRQEKRPRWHIDYLLPHASILAVILLPLDQYTECTLASRLILAGGTAFPSRFGASDCSCPGHLVHFPQASLTGRDSINKVKLNTILDWLKPTGGEKSGFQVQ